MKLIHFSFKNQHCATGSQINQWSELPQLPYHLGLPTGRPVLVIVGGASKMEVAALSRLQRVFTEIIAPLAQRLNATVIDGGTDCGVMQLMGRARHQIAGTFPLIGVCAIGTVILPDGSPPPSDEAAELEPHHSHFVLVPGDDWGMESPWLAKLATEFAEEAPHGTLVSNGGEITWQDVHCSVAEQRLTWVFEGSGRTADLLAAALRGEKSDPRAQPLLASGYLHRLVLSDDLTPVQSALETHFTTRGSLPST
ncbi:hypothetical protein NEA10_02850 [Phormidium yuhuli AB48]|uniref:LSDAT prokaryote domain-containing protein n=1 Tax=Phormidium yuhuli AB48 TaxID=2940671 RepID=A0ABY5AR32_9CYAN|nr:hypothetical protein [Phormidium yuhuli]USR91682.1 hypothetical protein NEA10_02850 [Phormidium yuhuli AB48]